MAIYSINIPDDLVPGIVAAAFAEDRQPEEIVQEYAVAVATKTCQDLKVGPFYQGPILPLFNADGTPFVAPEVAPLGE